VNLYGFANGDPINFGDPFGLCPSCGMMTMAVAGMMQNRSTDDKYVNDPRMRAEWDAAYALGDATEDPNRPGYPVEVAGFCDAQGCTKNPGDAVSSGAGYRPEDPLLIYHTHNAAGMPDPDSPGGVLADEPSDADVTNATTDPARRGINTYTIGPSKIHRIDRGTGRKTCYNRWIWGGGCK
jgi:hypothetical protein